MSMAPFRLISIVLKKEPDEPCLASTQKLMLAGRRAKQMAQIARPGKIRPLNHSQMQKHIASTAVTEHQPC
jgi:hypothetical protein